MNYCLSKATTKTWRGGECNMLSGNMSLGLLKLKFIRGFRIRLNHSSDKNVMELWTFVDLIVSVFLKFVNLIALWKWTYINYYISVTDFTWFDINWNTWILRQLCFVGYTLITNYTNIAVNSDFCIFLFIYFKICLKIKQPMDV